MFLDLWITSEVGNLVLIYMRSFFKDSYFATATAVIINVHFSITCLPLSYSSPSTTLCIITVTHRKSGGGTECVCLSRMCARVNKPVCLFVCLCKTMVPVGECVCLFRCVCMRCVCVCVCGVYGVCLWVCRVRGGCSVQCPPKAKTCQASILS